MDAIDDDNNILLKVLNNFNKQIQSCDKVIEKAQTECLLIEKDIIDAFKNIKKILDFLRKNALNKENRTIEIFIDEYKKIKSDKEKTIIDNLFHNEISLDLDFENKILKFHLA